MHSVLVVDDSVSMRLLMERMLREEGYRAILADSSDAALKSLEVERPLVALVDLSMEPVNGDECCRLIRERDGGQLPVIMMTAANAPHELMYCWRAGASDFVPKPVKRDQLRAKLQAISAPRVGPTGEGRWLLVVDDSRFFRSTIAGHLQHCGFLVREARSGDEAAALIDDSREDFAAFVLDLHLPGPGGLELAARLRASARYSQRPIALVTGSDWDATIEARCLGLTGRPPLAKATLPLDLLLSQIAAHVLALPLTRLRASERMPFFSIVTFAADGASPLSCGYSYDASPTGLFVRTLTPLPRGSPIELTLRWTGQQEDFKASGSVAWANAYAPAPIKTAPIGMGVLLTKFDSRLEAHLTRLCKPRALAL